MTGENGRWLRRASPSQQRALRVTITAKRAYAIHSFSSFASCSFWQFSHHNSDVWHSARHARKHPKADGFKDKHSHVKDKRAYTLQNERTFSLGVKCITCVKNEERLFRWHAGHNGHVPTMQGSPKLTRPALTMALMASHSTSSLPSFAGASASL
eukprot:1195718-Prorocentrum_minimum.AAC.8